MKKSYAPVIIAALLVLAACQSNTPAPQSEPDFRPPDYAPQDFQVWELVDPKDYSKPELIIPDGDSYRLDPEWEIKNISFTYVKHGIKAFAEYESQEIINITTGFWKDGKFINSNLVSEFKNNISNLYPSQFLMYYHVWDDNDPYWKIDITGTSGEIIWLGSASTGNMNAAPWNVYYNGRIYAQYDGSLGNYVAELFPSEISDPRWIDSADYTYFEPGGWPQNMIGNFDGIVPLKAAMSVHEGSNLGQNPKKILLSPPPVEILNALENNPESKGLLANHAVFEIDYMGMMSRMENNPGNSNIVGEATLLGESNFKGKPLRYSISTPFSYKNGGLIRWDLSNEKIDSLLSSIKDSNLFNRIFQSNSDIIINLFYAEKNSLNINYPDIERRMNYYSTQYELTLNNCESHPGVTELPSTKYPLQGFSIDTLPLAFVNWAEFLVIDNTPIVHDYDFSLPGDTGPGLDALLLPERFHMYTDIIDWISYSQNEKGASPVFLFRLLDNASQSKILSLENLLRSSGLVFDNSRSNDTRIYYQGALIIDKDGYLEIAPCSP